MLSRRHRCGLHPAVPPLEVAALGKELVANSTSCGGQQCFKVPLAHRYAIFLVGHYYGATTMVGVIAMAPLPVVPPLEVAAVGKELVTALASCSLCSYFHCA